MRDPLNNGQPRAFATPEDMRVEADKYFKWVIDNPIITKETTVTDKGTFVKLKEYIKPFQWDELAVFCGVYHLRNYRKLDDYLTVMTYIELTIKSNKFSGAVAGIFKENIIARDLGLAEQTKNENNHTLPEWMNEG